MLLLSFLRFKVDEDITLLYEARNNNDVNLNKTGDDSVLECQSAVVVVCCLLLRVKVTSQR